MKPKSIIFVALLFLAGLSSTLSLNAQVVSNFTFTASPASGCPPVSVTFTNTSSGAVSYLWDFGNSNTSTSTNPTVGALYTTAGTYTVTLTATNGGSNSTHTATITVHANPVANFTTSAMPSCTGQAVIFTDNSTLGSAALSSWIWDFGDGQGQTTFTGSVTHAYSTAGTNIPVSLIVTDANGCSSSIIKTVTIVAAPIAAFTGSPTSSCSAPLTVNFLNSSTTSGSVNYLWRFGDGATSVLTSPSHLYSSLGVYTVTLIVTQGGCTDSVVKTNYVSLINSITADFSADVTSACVGQLVTFYDLSSTITGTQSWDFGDGGTSTNTNPTHTYTSVGTYNVTLIEGPSGCQNTVTKNSFITVSASPVAAFTANQTQSCTLPFNVTFSNTSTSGASYYWDFGDWTTSFVKNPVHTYTSAGIYTVTLIVTKGGCSVTLTKPAYILIPNPDANYTATPRQGCVPLLVNFTDSSTSYFDPIVSYKWNFGNGSATTAFTTISNTYNSTGFFNVKLVVQTSIGCKDSITKIKYIKAGNKPKPDFSVVSSPVCYGTPAEFTDQSIGGDSAFWQFDVSEGSFSTPSGITLPFNPVTNIFPDTGTFYVKQTVFNNGCDSSIQKDYIIKILPPKPIFNYQLNCTNYFSVNFFSNSQGADSIVWDFGDGSPLLSDTLQPTHVFAALGSKTVTLTAYNFATNCSSSISQIFTIAEPKAEFNATPDKGCFPLNVNFFNTSQDDNSDFWIFGDGNSYLDTFSIIPYYYYVPKQDTVTLIITDINGCTDTTTRLINVYGPTPNFNANLLTGCAPFPVTLTDASISDSALVTWLWNFGDGSSDTLVTDTSINHTYTTPGFYTVTMTVKDTNGCVQALTRYQYIQPTYPFPAFVADTFACRNEAVAFNAAGTNVVFPAKFVWDFGDGFIDSTSGSFPSHSYNSDSLYTVTLTVTDVNGCDSSVQHQLRIQHPSAAFTDSVPLIQCGNTQMHYRDLSTGLDITQWYWLFGDGAFSFEQNPHHNYTVPGPYTVTLTVTNSAGCTNAMADSVFVPGPTGSFSFAPLTGCTPLAITFTAVSQSASSYTWDFGDGIVISNSPDSVIQHTYSDTITVTPNLILNSILPNGTPCTISASAAGKVIVTHPFPAFVVDTFACRNQSVTFDASGTIAASPAIYTWDFGDGSPNQNVGIPTISYTYASDSLYTVTLSVTDINGCASSGQIQHQIRIQNPKAAFNDSVLLESCDSTEMQFTDFSTGLSIIGWQWNFGDGLTSTLQNPLHNYTLPGNTTVTLIVTNFAGCKDTLSRNVFIPGPSAGTFYFTPHIGCLPLMVTFTAVSSVTTPTSYTWDFGDSFVISNSPDSIVQHTYQDTITTTPQLFLNFLLPNGSTCILPPDSAGVVSVKTIFPTFVSDTFACRNQSVIFNASGTIAAPPVNYDWDFGDNTTGTLINVAQITHLFSSDNYYTVTLTVTDANGCDSSIHVQHQIRIQNPQAAFSDSVFLESCDSTEMSFTDNSSGMAITAWQWDFGDGTTDTIQNPHHNYTTPGFYIVSLIVTNFAGCKDSLSKSVFVPGPSTGTFSFTPHAGCLPLTVTYTAVSSITIPTSYTWDFGDGIILSNSPDSLVQHTYPDTITTTPQLFLNFLLPDGNTCILPPDSAGVVSVKTVFPTFVTDTFACRNATVIFDASGTIAAPPATYEWNFGDGFTDTNTGNIVTHAYTSNGLYTVTLTVIDNNGCDSSIHIQHQIRIENPQAAFNDSVFIEGCDSTEMSYTDNSTGINIISWQWNFGDGTNSNMQNPHHTYTLPGVYTVTLSVSNNIGCMDSISKSINVPGPTGSFSFTPDTGCPPLTVIFTATSTSSSYFWDFGNGITLDTSSSVVYFTYPDTIAATPHLNITLSNGIMCPISPLSAPTTITVHPIVTAQFAVNSTSFDLPYELLICSNQSIWANTYTWNFGDGGTSTLTNPQYLYSAVGIYQIQLIAMSQFGCLDTAYTEVTTNADVIFPNAFTPSPDGSNGGSYDASNSLNNNIFFPYTSGVIDFQLRIYNRWGEQIFESFDIKKGWDGYYNNKLCEQGVYIWKAYLKLNNGKEFNKNGNVTLLR